MAQKHGFKRKPHYSLKEVLKEWQDNGSVNITRTAFRFAISRLGAEDLSDILKVAIRLNHSHFKKSVPSWSVEKEWHDHYHLPWDDPEMILLVKITKDEDGEHHLMVSLKGKDNDR